MGTRRSEGLVAASIVLVLMIADVKMFQIYSYSMSKPAVSPCYYVCYQLDSKFLRSDCCYGIVKEHTHLGRGQKSFIGLPQAIAVCVSGR